MTVQTILLLLLIGAAAGMLSGLVGVGGGVIIVPALVMVLGFSQHQAQGTSLGLLSIPVVAVAAFNYYKQGYIDIKVVLIMAVAFLIGGFLGSKLAVGLPQAQLKKIFAIVLLIIGGKMLFFDK